MATGNRSVVRVAASLLLAVAILEGCGRAGAPPTATPGPVTVRFAFRTNVANYMPLADAFHQQYPNITVQLVSSNSAQGQTQGQTYGMGLSLTLLKMQAVDAFRDTLPYLPDPQLKSELLPLDEYITRYKAFPNSDILPGLMDALKIEGTQTGIPAGVNPFVAYYDSRRLKNANVDPPAANWTLDDFQDIAVATNNQKPPATDNPNYVIGFCSDPMSADPVIITYLMGGQLVDSLQNPTRPMMNSAANQHALQWYASLRTVHKVTPDPALFDQTSGRGVYQAISLGRCGVWLGVYGDLRGRAWGTLWLGDPVMMALPRGQASFNAAAVDGYFVLRNAPHPQEAWLWLMFLLEHEDASGALMPVRASQIESQAFGERVTPDVLAVARDLAKSPATLISIGSQRALSPLVVAYLQAVARVVRGETDPKTALTAAQDSAQLLLGK